MLQSWSLVVFCFNEEKTVEGVITDAYRVLQQISTGDGEIVVVDDGSTDQSREIITRLSNRISCLRPVFHSTNMGIGAALTSGYNKAKNQNVCAIPADGQFNIEQLLNYPVIDPNTILSFYREKNEIYSRFRKLLSWSNKQILRYFFGVRIRDVNWVKVYNGDKLREISLSFNSSVVESEICVKMMRTGVKLIEVPTQYLPRNFGEPKGASFKNISTAAFELPRLYFIVRRFLKERKKKNA